MDRTSKIYKEMLGVYINACDTYSQDIIGLYQTLEAIYKKHYPVSECRREEEFIFGRSPACYPSVDTI